MLEIKKVSNEFQLTILINQILIEWVYFKKNLNIESDISNKIFVRKMEEYVVIIEVPKLSIPHPLSFRISDHKSSFYLYSHK